MLIFRRRSGDRSKRKGAIALSMSANMRDHIHNVYDCVEEDEDEDEDSEATTEFSISEMNLRAAKAAYEEFWADPCWAEEM